MFRLHVIHAHSTFLLLPTTDMAGRGVCIYFRKLQNMQKPDLAANSFHAQIHLSGCPFAFDCFRQWRGGENNCNCRVLHFGLRVILSTILVDINIKACRLHHFKSLFLCEAVID